MVKILSSNASKMYRNSEQYSDCSNLLMKADDPPLEELDPAILSCGLPAIILSEIQPVRPPPIRYSASQLQAIRKSSLSSRRPPAADDPKVSGFAIWRDQPSNPTSNRRNSKPPVITVQQNDHHKDHGGATGSNNIGKEKSPEQAGKPKYHHNTGRENGFVGSRFRRNYEFSNSNHYAIVKSYRSDGDQHHHLQNTVIEEEPEWVSAGPTSRLDTIELRGFDDDLSVSQSSSSDKATNGDGKNSSKNSGKHISFYDELHHYEHVHGNKKPSGGGTLKPHDSSGRENDVESVTTSNTSSPPPARSTPTKHMAEFNIMMEDAQRHSSSGVNVNNFEEFMKFDSLLGSDSAPGNNAQSGSRFSKWFRRGANSFNSSVGQNFDPRRHGFHQAPDNFGHGSNNRYPVDRNHPQQYHQPRYCANQGPGDLPTDSNSAFKRLVDMMAQNRANNNLVAQQQQYLLQMLNKNQQSEILRRMLIKNTVDNASDANHQQPTQGPRVPTQLELQLHTQSIMQNALLRKKLQDQRKMLLEQNSQIAEMAAAAAGKAKPNAEVQQFVKSVSPNIQRSLSLLSQTAGTGGDSYRSFNQTFPGGNGGMNNPTFAGEPHHPDLSASLRQMLLPQQQQQGSSRPFGNRRRYEKRSVTWKHPN